MHCSSENSLRRCIDHSGAFHIPHKRSIPCDKSPCWTLSFLQRSAWSFCSCGCWVIDRRGGFEEEGNRWAKIRKKKERETRSERDSRKREGEANHLGQIGREFSSPGPTKTDRRTFIERSNFFLTISFFWINFSGCWNFWLTFPQPTRINFTAFLFYLSFTFSFSRFCCLLLSSLRYCCCFKEMVNSLTHNSDTLCSQTHLPSIRPKKKDYPALNC